MVFSIIVIGIGGVILFSKQDEIVANIRQNVEKLYEDVSLNMKAISDLQEKLECCGAKDYRDFESVNRSLLVFPKSCCRDESKECRGPKEVIFVNTSPDELYFPVIISYSPRDKSIIYN